MPKGGLCASPNESNVEGGAANVTSLPPFQAVVASRHLQAVSCLAFPYLLRTSHGALMCASIHGKHAQL